MAEYPTSPNCILDMGEDEFRVIAERTLGGLPHAVIIVACPDYRVIFLNGASREVLRGSGIADPDEVLGGRPWDALPGWRDAFRSAYDHVNSTGEVSRFRDIRFHWGSETTYWDISLVPHKNSGGRVAAISTVAMNVTERRHSERLSGVLNDINIAINSTPDTEEVLREVVHQAMNVLSTDAAAVTLRDGDGWAAKYLDGFPGEPDGGNFSDEQSLVLSTVLESSDVVVMEEVTGSSGLASADGVCPQSVIAMPLIKVGKVAGVLAFYSLSKPLTFSEAQVDFARKLSASVSLAMQNMEAAREAERRAQEAEAGRRTLEALMQFAPEGITISDAPDGTIRMMSIYGQQLMGRTSDAPVGVPDKVRPDEWDVYCADGITRPDYSQLPSARAIRNGEVVTDEEWVVVGEDGRRIPLLVNAGPIRDADGEIVGSIAVWRDITSLKQTQLKLEEAYRRERHFAEVLQQALAPKTPSVGAGYAVAARYLPAYSEANLGGDFYDVFTTESGRLGVVIGDVSGKGVEAAAMAAAARSTVRAFAYEMSDVGEVLAHANSVLYPQQQWSSFITLLLAVIDPPTGRVEYASAGHPPPAIRRASGRIEFLGIGSPPFGLSSDMAFDSHQGCLNPGDRIVFYTDGISEARHDAVFFGTEGVAESLRRHGHLAPDGALDALIEEVGSFARGRMRDDAAVVMIARAKD